MQKPPSDDEADALEQRLAHGEIVNRAVAGVFLVSAAIYMVAQGLFWTIRILGTGGREPFRFVLATFAFAPVSAFLGWRILRRGWPGRRKDAAAAPVPGSTIVVIAVPACLVTVALAWLIFGR